MEERVDTTNLMSLRDTIAAEIMVRFWCGIGAILAAKMVHSLEYCIEELISRKC